MLTFYILRLQAFDIVFVYSGENDVQLAGVPRSRGVLSPYLLVADTGINCQFSSDKLGFERLMVSRGNLQLILLSAKLLFMVSYSTTSIATINRNLASWMYRRVIDRLPKSQATNMKNGHSAI